MQLLGQRMLVASCLPYHSGGKVICQIQKNLLGIIAQQPLDGLSQEASSLPPGTDNQGHAPAMSTKQLLTNPTCYCTCSRSNGYFQAESKVCWCRCFSDSNGKE